YGDKAIELVRANPYRLSADIWGVGFQTADALAQKLGIDPQSTLRAEAALRHVLQELAADGHCAFPREGVLERARELTGIATTTIAGAAAALVERKELILETEVAPEPWLYPRQLFFAESGAAGALRELSRGPHPLPKIDVDAALSWVEKKMG